MKSIKTPLLTAVVMGAALGALAQTNPNPNPGNGSTSPDPSNETNTTNASGARTESNTDVNGRVQPRPVVRPDGTEVLTDSDRKEAQSAEQREAERNAAEAERNVNEPKRKRTFWDKVFGRNKHLDADKTTEPGTTDAQ